MRTALLVLTAGSALAAAMPAVARDYPYCIIGCDFGSGLGDCSYSSYQQCQATAAGLVATCAPNPFYHAKADLLADRGRLSRRRF
jgi:Protein of unknown function (DUF3551)